MRRWISALAAACCLLLFTALPVLAKTKGVPEKAPDTGQEAADSLPLISSRSWPASGVTRVELRCGKGDSITIAPSEDGSITLQEYLSESGSRYCAAADRSGGVLTLTQGSRPEGAYHSRTVLLLPENYSGAVSVQNGGGPVSLHHMTGSASYDFSVTGGQIQISSVTAKRIQAACPRAGALTITDTTAALDADVSGSIRISNSSLCGRIQSSGPSTAPMTVSLRQLTGSLSIANASGSVLLELPAAASFRLSASVAKTGGRLVNQFGAGSFTANGNTLTGSNGPHPDSTVTVSASDCFTLQAAPEIRELAITAENLATVDVQLSGNGEYRYEYDPAKCTVTTAADGPAFAIHVAAKPGAVLSWQDRVIVYIPEQDCRLLTAVAENSGLSLPPVNADIRAVNNGGSLLVKLPSNYSKALTYTGVSGSGSLVLNGAADFTLTAELSSCAVSAPDGWPPCANGSSTYRHTSGGGTANLQVNLTNCSFSFLP